LKFKISSAYKLAREYTELYKPESGTGLIPESAKMLLEIAEFWCQYFWGQNLAEKFPKLMIINKVVENNTEN
jgi:hypothetical protein